MKIELSCKVCGKKFLRKKGEHNRNKKKGRQTYCSQKCNGKSRANLKRLLSYDNKFDGTEGYTTADEFTPFKWYIKCIYNSNRKKEKNITAQDLKRLWEEKGGFCPFTGNLLTLRTHSNCTEPLRPDHASLDRIDNNLGYVRGNIRFISVMANYARNKFTDAQLINFCCDVAEKYTGREV